MRYRRTPIAGPSLPSVSSERFNALVLLYDIGKPTPFVEIARAIDGVKSWHFQQLKKAGLIRSDSPYGERPDWVLTRTGKALVKEYLEEMRAKEMGCHMTDWQPIETAPKDETRIELYREGYAESRAIGWWSDVEQQWTPVHGYTFHGATHWKPLSEPPA